MQIKIEDRKNIENDLSLNNTKASFPMIWENVAGPVAVGGVSGSVNASTPSTPAETAEMMKIVDLSPTPINPTRFTTAIHAMVPKTLMGGNSFPGSFI
jgi:hypothetical protein